MNSGTSKHLYHGVLLTPGELERTARELRSSRSEIGRLEVEELVELVVCELVVTLLARGAGRGSLECAGDRDARFLFYHSWHGRAKTKK